jgi:hypothetical protein
LVSHKRREKTTFPLRKAHTHEKKRAGEGSQGVGEIVLGGKK